MTGLFLWTMRHGAKIVFVVALLQLVAGLLLPLAVLIAETSRMAADHSYAADGDYATVMQMSQILYSLTSFALLLIGALLVDRADRWFALRDRETAR